MGESLSYLLTSQKDTPLTPPPVLNRCPLLDDLRSKPKTRHRKKKKKKIAVPGVSFRTHILSANDLSRIPPLSPFLRYGVPFLLVQQAPLARSDKGESLPYLLTSQKDSAGQYVEASPGAVFVATSGCPISLEIGVSESLYVKVRITSSLLACYEPSTPVLTLVMHY